MSDDVVFHITERSVWEAALEHGAYRCATRGTPLSEVGFVHCSSRDQVAPVADMLYGDSSYDLVVLEIDVRRVEAPVRFENLEGGTELFPHVYGPIPCAAVHAVHRLLMQSGRWAFESDR
jgi:uncharacterized protein (DUF952 family)